MKENEFQEAIIDLAHLYGYKVAHFRPAQTSKGWRTPVSADGKGFPDLILVKPSRLIVVEVKSENGKLSPEQEDWRWAFDKAGVEWHVYRPSDFDRISEELK